MLGKNQAALSFIFPEIGQTSLGIPSPGELQGRQEARKCVVNRGAGGVEEQVPTTSPVSGKDQMCFV